MKWRDIFLTFEGVFGFIIWSTPMQNPPIANEKNLANCFGKDVVDVFWGATTVI